MIESLEHTGLSVSNLDRSVAFYRDVLGMEVIRILECMTEMRLGDIVALPNCQARIAHLQKGGKMLEIFQYQNPKGKSITDDRTQADHGFSHLGFKTTDALSDYDRLKKLGVKFLSEPVEFRPGVWVVYFYGPDGEVCELRQT